jgi:hypothetical protein
VVLVTSVDAVVVVTSVDAVVLVTSVDAVVQRKMVALPRNKIFRRASDSITAVLNKLQHV